MRARLFVIAASIAAVAYACGGADPIVIGNGDAGDNGGGDDASTGRRDAGGRDASISGGDAGGDDGGTTRDSGSTDSGSRDSGSDAGVHPHRDGGIVPCGEFDDAGLLTCNDSQPVCCGIQWDVFLGTDSNTFICSSSAGACTSFDAGQASNVAIACRDESYCPGEQVCCGHLVAGSFESYYESVDCQSSCPLTDDAGIVDTDFRRFCDPSGPDECSATGETCGPSAILPGFNVCQ